MKKPVLIWICSLMIPLGLIGQNKTIQPDLKQFSVDLNSGYVQRIAVDTLITGSQITHPLYRKFPGWAEMGNTGLPAIPLKFTGIGKTKTPAFLKPYLNYVEDEGLIRFYDTKTPFSQIGFDAEVTGDKSKVNQGLNFIYSRSLGKDINIVGLFDFISSDGNYDNQSAIESVIGLKIAVRKENYKNYSKFERIQFKLQENGGVKNDDEVITTTGRFTSLVSVNLNKATSKTNILRLSGWQSLNIFSSNSSDSLSVDSKRKFKPALVHRYDLLSSGRLFNDGPLSMDYYNDTLIDGELTRDSVQTYSFINDIRLRGYGFLRDSSEWLLEAGLHHELLHFYSYGNPQWMQGIGISGFSSINFRSMRLTADAELIFAGYEAGDYRLDLRAGVEKSGDFSGPVVKMTTEASSPDLFTKSYYGNHFQWDNSFKKQILQSAGLSWDIPKIKINLDVQANLISNWIYFNYDAKPAQRENSALLLAAGISKPFSAGPFRSRNEIYLNYTTAEEIPLPLIVASSSLFMHHDIHFEKTQGLLQLEYGFDIRYASSYKGFAYMPATGVFFLQKERVLGNYPFVDLFLIMRVKRTRFFIKWNHVNSGFTGDDIFPVLHYPVKERIISYGIFWHFYD